MAGSASARGSTGRQRIAEILARSREQTAASKQRAPLYGVGGQDAYPRSMASQMGDRGMVAPPLDPLAFQGVPRFEDLGPIQREEEGRRAYQRASQDYSMLPDEVGPLSPIASIVADPIADAIDVGGAAFGDPASRTRTMARHERLDRGMGQAGRDLIDPADDGNFLAQMLRDVPAGMRAEDEARAAQFIPAKNGLERAGDVLNGLWAGWPQAGRDARGRAAESQALADYEARDAELAGARGEITPPWAEQVAQGEAERAQGEDFWINAPAALEGIPGVGLIDMAAPLARSAGRAGLRAAGQNIPEMLARPVDPLADMPMTRGYRNEGALARDAIDGGRQAIENTPILRDVAPYAGDWVRGTWEGRAATVPLAGAATFALSDETDLDERLLDAGGAAGLAYLGGGLAGGLARTAPRALRDIEVSRATRMPERAPIDVDFSVYRPDEFTEVYVHPDGEIVAKYQGAFESGGGSAAEALRVFRGMERSLGEDIAAHQRPEYHWVPGPSRQHDPKLAEFYREAMRMRAPPGYVFSETPDGVMHLTRSESGVDPVRGVNFGEQLNRDGSVTPVTPIESQGEPDFDLNEALSGITRNVNDDGSPYDDWIGLDGIVPDVGPTRREMLPELQRRQREIDDFAQQDHLTPPTVEGIIANPTQAQWDIDQYLGTFSAAPRHGKPRISADMPLLGVGAALTGGAVASDYLDDGELNGLAGPAVVGASLLMGPGGRGLRPRLTAAIRDPETGRIFTGANHAEAIGSAPRNVQTRLEAAYAENGANVGFQNADGAFMDRDAALASLGEGAFGRAHASDSALPVNVSQQQGEPLSGTSAQRRGVDSVRREQVFHDERLSPQQNKAVEMARNNYSNAEIAEELDISVGQARVVLAKARARGVEVDRGLSAGGAAREGAVPIQRLVALRDELVKAGYANRRGPNGGDSLNRVIAERLGMHPNTVSSRLTRYDRQHGSDPLTGIAPPRGPGRDTASITNDPSGQMPRLDTTPSVNDPVAMRMERARRMGFDVDTPLYVSSLEDLRAFKERGDFYGNSGLAGIHLTDNPEMASRYLDRYGNTRFDGVEFQKNVMPVFIRPGTVREISGRVYDGPQAIQGFPVGDQNYQWPRQLDGVDTVIRKDSVSSTGDVSHLSGDDLEILRVLDETDPTYQGGPIAGREYILRDPTRIRSRFAAFDPARAGESDLLAGIALATAGGLGGADYLSDGDLDYGGELASAALLGVGARNLSRVGERVSGPTSVASGMPPGGGRARSPAVQRLAELPSGSDFMLTGDMHWLGKTGRFERTGIGDGTDFRIARVFDDVGQAEDFAGSRADEVMGVTTSPDGRTMVVLKNVDDFSDEGMATMTDADGNTITGSPESVGEVFERGGINRALEAPPEPAPKPARTPRRGRNDPLNSIALAGATGLGATALLGEDAGAEEGGALADGRRITPIPRGEEIGSGEQIGDWADVRLADGSTGKTAVFLYPGPDGSYHTRIVVARDLGRGAYDVLGSVNPEPTTDAGGDRLYGSDAEQAAYDHLNEVNEQGDALRGVETGGMGVLPYGEPDLSELPAPVGDQTAVSASQDALSGVRFGASALLGLATRGGLRAFRSPLRGVGADLAAGAVAGSADLAMGGDPLTEAAPAFLGVTGLSSLGRMAARERGAARPSAAIEQIVNAPDFAVRRDAFAANLEANAPVARQIEANQASVIEGPFNVEGREVPSVLGSREEVAEQGFARNRVNEPSMRERFLAMEPEDQAQWMQQQAVLEARIPRDWATPATPPERLPDTDPRVRGAAIEPLSPRSDIPPELIGSWDSALFGVTEAATPRAPRAPRPPRGAREPSAAARLTRVLMDIPAQVPDGLETMAQLKRYVREQLRASGMAADEIAALLQKHNAKLVAALGLGGAGALGAQDPLAGVSSR